MLSFPTHPRDGEHSRFWLAACLVGAALLPAVAGLALLISVWARRPLLAKRLRVPRDAAASVTLAWGVGLLVIAGAQGAAELAGVASMTSAAGLLVRTAAALAVELVLLGASRSYVGRLTAAA